MKSKFLFTLLFLLTIFLVGCGGTIQSKSVTLPNGAAITSTDSYLMVGNLAITGHNRIQEQDGLRISESNFYLYGQFIEPEGGFGPVIIPGAGYKKPSSYY